MFLGYIFNRNFINLFETKQRVSGGGEEYSFLPKEKN